MTYVITFVIICLRTTEYALGGGPGTAAAGGNRQPAGDRPPCGRRAGRSGSAGRRGQIGTMRNTLQNGRQSQPVAAGVPGWRRGESNPAPGGFHTEATGDRPPCGRRTSPERPFRRRERPPVHAEGRQIRQRRTAGSRCRAEEPGMAGHCMPLQSIACIGNSLQAVTSLFQPCSGSACGRG